MPMHATNYSIHQFNYLPDACTPLAAAPFNFVLLLGLLDEGVSSFGVKVVRLSSPLTTGNSACVPTRVSLIDVLLFMPSAYRARTMFLLSRF